MTINTLRSSPERRDSAGGLPNNNYVKIPLPWSPHAENGIPIDMKYITGEDRSQLLLPESVEDYAGPDNPVRFTYTLVDSLDLETAGFSRLHPKATGRQGFDPGDLLKIYTYGYLNRIRLGRRLEAETHQTSK